MNAVAERPSMRKIVILGPNEMGDAPEEGFIRLDTSEAAAGRTGVVADYLRAALGRTAATIHAYEMRPRVINTTQELWTPTVGAVSADYLNMYGDNTTEADSSVLIGVFQPGPRHRLTTPTHVGEARYWAEGVHAAVSVMQSLRLGVTGRQLGHTGVASGQFGVYLDHRPALYGGIELDPALEPGADELFGRVEKIQDMQFSTLRTYQDGAFDKTVDEAVAHVLATHP